MEYVPILIVGSGVAGLSTAYYLKKQNIDFKIITKTKNVLQNNTALAPANTRIPDDIEEVVKQSVEQCGANKDIIEKIYLHSNEITKMFEFLNVSYKKSKFGVIPDCEDNCTGGTSLSKKISKYIGNIYTNKLLIDIIENNNYIYCLIYDLNENKMETIVCTYLVLSTGGFGGIFKQNDNNLSTTGNGIAISKKLGAKIKGMSTIMIHPFGIHEGGVILTGNIVSLSNGNIVNRNGERLKTNIDIVDMIKNNSYHDSDKFIYLVNTFSNLIKEHGDIYLDFSECAQENLKNQLATGKYSYDIVKDYKIKIVPTVHYTSGGIVVDEEFKITNNIFANGELIFDGDKGIGRLPGQAFASSIVSGKLICDVIKKKENFLEPNMNTICFESIEAGLLLAIIDIESFEKNNQVICDILEETRNSSLNEIRILEYEQDIDNIIKEFLIAPKRDKIQDNGIILLNFYYKCIIVKELLKDVRIKNISNSRKLNLKY